MANAVVWIISKNEIIREGLRRILVEQSFVVEQVAGESNELEEMDESDADRLIVIDANSVSEGITACRELRDRFESARIVLMTDEFFI